MVTYLNPELNRNKPDQFPIDDIAASLIDPPQTAEEYERRLPTIQAFWQALLRKLRLTK